MASLLTHPGLVTRFARTRVRRYARGIQRSVRENATGAAAQRGHVGTLHHVVVTESMRCRGVGAVLVSHFMEIAQLCGTQKLVLYTSRDNGSAQRFYERLGWKPESEQADADGELWIPFSLKLE